MSSGEEGRTRHPGKRNPGRLCRAPNPLRKPMLQDPARPTYHFSPNHWMNDPKPFFANGEYHVFFQHNPNSAGWGMMHWGHAVSRDLVHWQELPIALAPAPGEPD